MNEMKIKELKAGWLIILATVLQYVVGYPANILPMCGILFATKYEAFEASGTEKAVIIGLFTVFMNIVSMFVGPLVKAKSPRFVAFLATSSQLLGLVICAFSGSTAVIMVGFGILVGAGVGLSLVNNIFIVKKKFPNIIGIVLWNSFNMHLLSRVDLPQIMHFQMEYFQACHEDVLNQCAV